MFYCLMNKIMTDDLDMRGNNMKLPGGIDMNRKLIKKYGYCYK